MEPTRFPPTDSLQRVAFRAIVGACLAAGLVLVVTHVVFAEVGGGFPSLSVRWATFAFTVPWMLLVEGRARAPFGLALLAGHALYVGPVLMKSASALLAPFILGPTAPTPFERLLERLFFSAPFRLRWELLYQSLPLTLFLILLLESRRVPRTAWWLRVLVTTASAGLGDLLFWHGKLEPVDLWQAGVLSSPYVQEHCACVGGEHDRPRGRGTARRAVHRVAHGEPRGAGTPWLTRRRSGCLRPARRSVWPCACSWRARSQRSSRSSAFASHPTA